MCASEGIVSKLDTHTHTLTSLTVTVVEIDPLVGILKGALGVFPCCL